VPAPTTLADRIDAALPQTQCTRCGFPDCRSYAAAIAHEDAPINRCPPGGAEGIARLAVITGRAEMPLDPANGIEAPRKLAWVDESWCIGCTLCIKACPVDCIVGASKRMHVVIEALCTGCELCVPACPVDCILLEDATPGRTGWAAWSPARADEARQRYAEHQRRVERERRDNDERLARKAAARQADLPAHGSPSDAEAQRRQRATIEAALERARAKRSTA
jgi:electron transport complex protein RnfB